MSEPDDRSTDWEARLLKVEETLQQLLAAGLDKCLASASAESAAHSPRDACQLHVPEDSFSHDGVRPPEDPPPLPAHQVPLRTWSAPAPVQPADEPPLLDDGDADGAAKPVPADPRPSAAYGAFSEPTEALQRYHARASVVQRREHGVDYHYMATQTKEYYTFGESTWDLVLLIGTGTLGPAGAAQTIVLVVMNILMQGVFVGIAWFNFLEPDLDAETMRQDAFRWRRSSAHSLSEYDAVSRMSLAERVCTGDKSLHLSGVQMGLIEDIGKYLKPTKEGLETYFAGPVLCMVALICWYMMVGKEISHALGLHRGLLAIPRGENKIEPRENPFTQITHLRLVSITNRRVVASYCLLIYRLFAAALLIYVGTFFLVYTIDVTELILNAVALEIILDIDDLIFDSLATTTGRHLVHHLEPLPMPSLPRVRGADIKSILMSCILPVIAIWVYLTMLAPMVQDLGAVYNDLCGGYLGFVWSVDKRHVVHFAQTQGDGWENSTGSLQLRGISEAIALDAAQLQRAELGLWHSDVTRLIDSETMSLDELVDQGNPYCEDLATTGPMLNLLRDSFNNQSIASCADVLPFCDSISKMPEWEVDGGRGFLTRMLCSETCGCSDPGGLFVNVQGCPYGRNRPCQSSAKFKAAVQSATCEEKSAEELRQFGPWISWISKLRTFGQTPSGILLGQAESLLLAQAMWDHGCDFGYNLSAQNISWGDCTAWNPALGWDFKTLEFFCPTSCSCDRSKANSACPQPKGVTCDELRDCVFVQNTYACRGEVPSLPGSIDIDIPSDSFQQPLLLVLQSLLAETAGVAPAAVKVQLEDAPPPPNRRLRVQNFYFEIFLLEAERNQVEDALSSTSLDNVTASCQMRLQELVESTELSMVSSVSVQSFELF